MRAISAMSITPTTVPEPRVSLSLAIFWQQPFWNQYFTNPPALSKTANRRRINILGVLR
jgi:hypothetical protein